MSIVDFVCVGCGLEIPRDRYGGDEYLWWKACVAHFNEQHPDRVMTVEEPA